MEIATPVHQFEVAVVISDRPGPLQIQYTLRNNKTCACEFLMPEAKLIVRSADGNRDLRVNRYTQMSRVSVNVMLISAIVPRGVCFMLWDISFMLWDVNSLSHSFNMFFNFLLLAQ